MGEHSNSLCYFYTIQLKVLPPSSPHEGSPYTSPQSIYICVKCCTAIIIAYESVALEPARWFGKNYMDFFSMHTALPWHISSGYTSSLENKTFL